MSVWDEFTSDERRESLRSLGQSGEWAAERIKALEDALRDVRYELNEINFKFLSGNSVPIERVSIKASECEALWMALLKASALLGGGK